MKTLLLLVLFATTASAGFLEVGVSGSYRESFIRSDINSKSSSMTGSFSYYFMERSAVQFSFTQAVRRDSSPAIDALNEVTPELEITEMNIVGMDFVLSFAGRKERFQPFVKAGVAQIKKSFTRQLGTSTADTVVTISGLSISAGLGMKILLSDRLSVNFTVDGWTAPLSEDLKSNDIRVLGGFSWFL